VKTESTDITQNAVKATLRRRERVAIEDYGLRDVSLVSPRLEHWHSLHFAAVFAEEEVTLAAAVVVANAKETPLTVSQLQFQ